MGVGCAREPRAGFAYNTARVEGTTAGGVLSEFHYVRTMGVDGGVSAVEGPAVGLDVETILKDGLPPFKVAIEIMAAMCEIIDIADQDGEAHGELIPRYVFLDETGAVSIEGYGNKRTKTTAPERVPKGTVTDQWCLGYVAFRLLSAKDLPAPLPEEAQAYDDAIIDAILGINFEDLPEEIIGDIQWFVAKLMSFEKEDRPSAVDVWRTFIAFADSIPGPRLDDWATAALGGGGDRRDKQKAAARPEAPKPTAAAATGDEEDLGGPVMQSGPLAKGGLSFDGGGKKGQATAFWSKEDMKKALEEDDDAPSRKPKAGGATAFWSKDQMKAMDEGKADAPRPKRKENSTRPATMMMKPPKREDEEPDLDRPGKSPVPKKAPPPPPVNQGSQAPKQAQQAVAQQPMLPPPAPADAPPEGGGPPWAIIGVVVFLIVVVLGGGAFVLLGGGGALLWANNNAAAEAAAAAAEEERVRLEEEAETQRLKEERDRKKAEAAAKKKAEEEAAAAAGTKPGTKPGTKVTPPKTTPGGTTPPKTTPPKTTPKVKPTPVAAAPSGPAVLTLRSAGRGKLSCSDGQAPAFDGMARVEFDPYTLPVTCMVTIDGKRGAISIEKSTTQTCNVSGSDVICN